jgi:hypothetical protein
VFLWRLRKKKRGFADSRPLWIAYWEPRSRSSSSRCTCLQKAHEGAQAIDASEKQPSTARARACHGPYLTTTGDGATPSTVPVSLFVVIAMYVPAEGTRRRTRNFRERETII